MQQCIIYTHTHWPKSYEYNCVLFTFAKTLQCVFERQFQCIAVIQVHKEYGPNTVQNSVITIAKLKHFSYHAVYKPLHENVRIYSLYTLLYTDFLLFSWDYTIFLIYFIDFCREREEGRERDHDLLFHLFMHSLVDSCMCPDIQESITLAYLDSVSGWYIKHLV